MPIALKCEHCGKGLKVRDDLAGKKVKCPQCQNALRIPVPAAPAEQWHLQTEDGDTYGPVDRAELDRWATEGRITADCHVLRDGAEQWQWATDLYPQLSPTAAEPAEPAEPAQPAAPQQPAKPASSPKLAAAPQQPAQPQSSTPAPSPAAAETPQTPAPAAKSKSGPFDFSALDTGPKPQAAGPLDFAPAETTSTTPSGAFDFNVSDASRSGARGRASSSKKGKSKSKITKAKTATAGEVGSDEVGPKSKLVTLLLAFFLGGLGVHRFYLGYTLIGALMLVTLGGCGIWALIDFILILIGKVNRDAQGRLLKD